MNFGHGLSAVRRCRAVGFAGLAVFALLATGPGPAVATGDAEVLYKALSTDAKIIVDAVNRAEGPDLTKFCQSNERGIREQVSSTTWALAESEKLGSNAFVAGEEAGQYYRALCTALLTPADQRVAASQDPGRLFNGLSDDAKAIVTAVNNQHEADLAGFCRSGTAAITRVVTNVATDLATSGKVTGDTWAAGEETARYYPTFCRDLITRQRGG